MIWKAGSVCSPNNQPTQQLTLTCDMCIVYRPACNNNNCIASSLPRGEISLGRHVWNKCLFSSYVYIPAMKGKQVIYSIHTYIHACPWMEILDWLPTTVQENKEISYKNWLNINLSPNKGFTHLHSRITWQSTSQQGILCQIPYSNTHNIIRAEVPRTYQGTATDMITQSWNPVTP